MLYFAYGSNMDWTQMKERCPSARFVDAAVLREYKLMFTRESRNRGCGVADVVSDADSAVWGVVYELAEIDLGKLDKAEGYRPGRQSNSYWRREALVFLDDDDQKPCVVAVYFGEVQANPPLPSAEYRDLLLSGARYWHLPNDYIRELEEIEVSN